MAELLQILFLAAIQFSGLQGVQPPVAALHHHEMMLQVCADLAQTPDYQDCVNQHGLVAAYIIEQHRVVYDMDNLNLNDDTDNSYVVHEFTHSLQAQTHGDGIFTTCEGVFAAEKEAYFVQQKYLKSRSQFRRVGDRLRYITCESLK
jgi:hypothetical protein